MRQFELFSGLRAPSERRKYMLRAVSIAVSASMALAVVGCGKKKERTAETVAADSAYFSVQDLDFYEPREGEDCYVVSMTPCGDKIALLLNVNYYGDGLLEGGKDGYAVATVAAAEAKEAPVATTRAAETAETATDTAAPSDEPAETTSGGDVTIEPTKPGDGEYYSKFYLLIYANDGTLDNTIDLSEALPANSSVMSLASKPDGSVVIFAQSYDEVTYEAVNVLYTFDANGDSTGEPMTMTFDANFYPSNMKIGADGTMYFGGYADMATIVALDSTGKFLYKISESNLNGTLYLVDGKLYTDGYEKEKYTYQFYPIDTAAKKLGDPIDMSKFQSGAIYGGLDGLYLNDAFGIFKVDLEKLEKTEILRWKDVDLKMEAYGSNQSFVLSSDRIMIIATTYSQTDSKATTTASILTREAKNPNAGKKIIVIAGIGIIYDSTIQTEVYAFNKTSTDYRIEIRDYAEDTDYSGIDSYDEYLEIYNNMISKMNLEILSGKGPDILYGYYESFKNFETRGLFENLYKLMDKDTGFKKDDYLPSIFKMCETDGKLYKIGTGFYIYGLMGAKSVIGDRTGWTLDEFNEMVNSLPSGMKPLSGYGYTQTNLLQYSLSASLDTFVNAETGEVNFDSDEFCQVLDFAKTYGSDDDATDGGGEYVDEYTMIKNHELAMMQCWIGNASSYDQMAQVFGEPVSVTGFPTPDKSGPLCSLTTMLAISSESANIDACWTFVKSFLDEESQMQVSKNYQIPVLKSAFEAQIESAIKGEDGGNIVYKEGDGAYGQTPMTEESAQNYRNLVDSLDTLQQTDTEIFGVISEEVPAYFNGQKSDKDVAAIIQDRVQTIVNERS